MWWMDGTCWLVQPSGTAKSSKEGATWKREAWKVTRGQRQIQENDFPGWMLLPPVVFISGRNTHHQIVDIHTSVYSFQTEKRDTYDVFSGDMFALFSFLFAITLITFTYVFWLLASCTGQKTLSVILISKCSQTGVRFGFLKHRHYDFIAVRAALGFKNKDY